MTKQQLKRDIQALYPGAVLLNTKDTAKIIGKHPNKVPEYMRGYESEKSGNSRYYFIGDIADCMYKRTNYM